MTVSSGAYCFVDRFTHTIDSQRRFAIPSEWRRSDSQDHFVLLPAREHLIQAIPAETFQEEILAKAKKLSLADAKGMRELAILGSRALNCSCDKQGRIQISPQLMDYAGLTNKVVLVGSLWCIQLWSPERWAPYELGEADAQDNNEEYFDILEKINAKSSGGLDGLLGGLTK